MATSTDGAAQREPVSTFARDLHDLRTRVEPRTRSWVAEVVRAHAVGLAGTVFVALRADPQARTWIDAPRVARRLQPLLAQWLEELFAPDASVEALVRAQHHTGEAHGRCLVPQTLLLRASRTLERSLVLHLQAGAPPRPELLQAMGYVDELLSLAIEALSASAAASAARMRRSADAYRLSVIGHDLRAERERRCRELLEWVQWTIDRCIGDGGQATATDDPPLAFPLWLRHKASVLFEGEPELPLIRAEMRSMTLIAQPAARSGPSPERAAAGQVGRIRRCAVRARQQLEALFDRHEGTRGSRDPQTRLLHRRYFATLVQREILHARGGCGGLALLMIEIDGFAQAASGWGLQTAGVVVDQVGTIIEEHVRAGDLVCRVGEAAFAVLLVECPVPSLRDVAESLGRRISAHAFQRPGAGQTGVSVGIGIAPHEDELDHQRLIDRADRALHRALAEGPGQCRFADAAPASRTTA